ncbi:MAG: DNA-directed RNA polymerase subunit omega [Candidatus Krumholzibacteria bacterium]|nr:DNA-directed RNA polymerase subunit omega [Candidatus Krumholzibacteria bacterium]
MKIDEMEKILRGIDNRYEAIRVIAREARNINNILRFSGQELEEKPTTLAVNRLIEGKLEYRYVEPGEEQN